MPRLLISARPCCPGAAAVCGTASRVWNPLFSNPAPRWYLSTCIALTLFLVDGDPRRAAILAWIAAIWHLVSAGAACPSGRRQDVASHPRPPSIATGAVRPLLSLAGRPMPAEVLQVGSGGGRSLPGSADP